MTIEHIEQSIQRLRDANKPILYTYGFRYRHPTTLDVPITIEKAREILENGRYAHYDIDETEKAIHLNLYSANDMW